MELRVKGVSFRYGSREVLRGVSVEVGAGEVLGVVGPNGAGKSTLLRCVGHILRPQVGTVLVDGKDLARLAARERARRVGYVPQGSDGVFPGTVLEAILLGRKPHLGWGVSAHDLEVVARIMGWLGVEHLAGRRFAELSGGEKQKVLLARALAQEPEVLLLDEPTSNLDIRCQLEVMALLGRLARERKKCVLVAMHDLGLAARHCDRLLMLKEGEVFAVGTPGEVLNPQNLREVYGVEVHVAEGPAGLEVTALAPVLPQLLPRPADGGGRA
jgi:iron complex transport system ATP-binding protein